MSRKEQLEAFIKQCCENSSIYYAGKHQAVKYLRGRGIIVYIEQSRMLDYCEFHIPDYAGESDDMLIEKLMSEGKEVRGCESHDYMDCHYTYSFMLK